MPGPGARWLRCSPALLQALCGDQTPWRSGGWGEGSQEEGLGEEVLGSWALCVKRHEPGGEQGLGKEECGAATGPWTAAGRCIPLGPGSALLAMPAPIRCSRVW